MDETRLRLSVNLDLPDGQGDEVARQEDIDRLTTKTDPIDILWVDGRMPDPVFAFWRLLNVGVLAPVCYVIFVNVKDSPAWADLVKVYGGLRFGSIFLLVCDSTSTSVPVVPSQRGLFRNEEKGSK